MLFPFWTPLHPLTSPASLTPSLSLFPSLGPVTLPLTLCISISLHLDHSPLPPLPWSEFLTRFFFSLQPLPYCWATSLSADPEWVQIPLYLTSHNPPSFICLSWLVSLQLSLVSSFFLTPPLPLISPLLAVAHIPFLMRRDL